MPDNAAARAAITAHHAQLAGELGRRTVSVQDAADRLRPGDTQRAGLLEFLHGQVLPHAAAEEAALYRVGVGLEETRLLVSGMLAEHRALESLVGDLATARTPSAVAGVAHALRILFGLHLGKENDLLLPALDDAGVDLAGLLDGMHEILGSGDHGRDETGAGGCGCGDCECGRHTSAEVGG